MKQATIVVTGAGSGGHITPLLAVTAALKEVEPALNIVYIGQTGDSLGDIPAADPHVNAAYTVRAGKLRRYHGEGFKQLLDLKTMALNLRDAVYVLIGIVQSLLLLHRLRPDVVFIKGGFVGVPIGLAAACLRIPYITHDSDAIPGLANRIIARWAQTHAVAMDEAIYPYPQDKTVTTGIPLQAVFEPVTNALQAKYRRELGLPEAAHVLFVIGGGLGSRRVNEAVADIVPHLLRDVSNLYILQAAGRQHADEVSRKYDEMLPGTLRDRVRVKGYIEDNYRYSGAADVVITRGGATNLAEFALQAKPCVVIPAPFLTGGQQLKNAQYLADRDAAVVLDEQSVVRDANKLAKELVKLLEDKDLRQKLAKNIAEQAEPHAAQKIANLLLEQTTGPKKRDEV
jgi:UDP-N-acetylglucosamine--N-acetylmuramyl-(pentapeptide) pyrophosphoryl-undecaprenol N-acetylglucosamine transferase